MCLVLPTQERSVINPQITDMLAEQNKRPLGRKQGTTTKAET